MSEYTYRDAFDLHSASVRQQTKASAEMQTWSWLLTLAVGTQLLSSCPEVTHTLKRATIGRAWTRRLTFTPPRRRAGKGQQAR